MALLYSERLRLANAPSPHPAGGCRRHQAGEWRGPLSLAVEEWAFRPTRAAARPDGCLQWLGPDVFYSVKFVDVDADLGSRADDNLMSWVGQLRDLEVLNVHGNRDVTDVPADLDAGLRSASFTSTKLV